MAINRFSYKDKAEFNRVFELVDLIVSGMPHDIKNHLVDIGIEPFIMRGGYVGNIYEDKEREIYYFEIPGRFCCENIYILIEKGQLAVFFYDSEVTLIYIEPTLQDQIERIVALFKEFCATDYDMSAAKGEVIMMMDREPDVEINLLDYRY